MSLSTIGKCRFHRNFPTESALKWRCSVGSGPHARFNEQGGVVDCPMMRGPAIKIWMTKDGVKNSALPSLLCTWQQFDDILEKAIALGGIMYRGDTAAQNGSRIGSKELPLDTMESFIAMNYFGRKEGETTVRRSTYYAAIMKWAGVCDNCRSDGNGGYISVAKWLMQ